MPESRVNLCLSSWVDTWRGPWVCGRCGVDFQGRSLSISHGCAGLSEPRCRPHGHVGGGHFHLSQPGGQVGDTGSCVVEVASVLCVGASPVSPRGACRASLRLLNLVAGFLSTECRAFLTLWSQVLYEARPIPAVAVLLPGLLNRGFFRALTHWGPPAAPLGPSWESFPARPLPFLGERSLLPWSTLGGPAPGLPTRCLALDRV